MNSPMQNLLPPSKALLLLEGGRALFEFGLLGPSLPLLRAAPRGDRHPVMVLPGMAAGDRSTFALRRFLRHKGYAVHGWGQGRNVGSEAIFEPLMERVMALRREHHEKVSLVGWSLGGVYARELAKIAPREVRCVITLGSPFRGPHKASNVWRFYEFLSGSRIDEGASERFAQTPSVPTTAIYTRTDGIVAWQRCIEDSAAHTENIEVIGSHSGLGHNALAMYAVADRLAQPKDNWRAFQPPRALRRLYGNVKSSQ